MEETRRVPGEEDGIGGVKEQTRGLDSSGDEVVVRDTGEDDTKAAMAMSVGATRAWEEEKR